ncbi:hypothetical protein KZZ10_10330 [Alcaligenaceae bacterium LF4-65]|uniref:Uncharacterized protein n=1 Tax=Zwartia hollandica TaxID=324606 RepID=A0A953NB36_9BURK|nr:hypothetical protein [Zwartia hollandica]MBZ1351042.1 hypothetical protein [Zwartia hollandica]
MWEQLASDLFVSNLEQPVWGWSNAQSIALLDFWQAFDPQLRFILVACSAQRFIASALESGEAVPTTSVLLEQWAAQHLQMLHFYHRFPQKAVLVDIDHCIDNPAGLLKVCQQSWQLGLSKVHFPSQPAPTLSVMSRFLAENLSQTDPLWLPLQNELSSSATAIGTLWKKPSRIDIADAVHAYRDEKYLKIEPSVSAKEIELLNAAQQALIEWQTKNQDLNTELTETRAKHAADLEALTAQLHDAKEEANLLLAQLHQVREELENYFLELQNSKKNIEMAERSVGVLSEENNSLKEQLGRSLADLEKSKSALLAAQVQSNEAQERVGLLLSQLPQVQEELKNNFLELQNSKKNIEMAERSVGVSSEENNSLKEQLGRSLADSEKSVSALSIAQHQLTEQQAVEQALNTLLNDERTQREDAAARLKGTQAQLKDTQEESELLLAQLHQVQEELEHYFLKYQDSEQELEAAALRWKRMLQRTPDYFDLESIEVQSIEGVSAETLRWHLKGLEAAGRKLPELELTTFVVDGIAGLELPRKMGGHNIIQRWPAVVASDETLVVAWLGDANADEKLTQTLRQLGRSDWDLIQVIITALRTSLNTPGILKRTGVVVTENTLPALGALQSKLSQMPRVFRFDELTLMREQVNHDYEHLWLNFRHVAIGDRRLFDFDFRVSCANLRPNVFGRHPKLEFPETSGRAAFTEWFDESYDDFGPKLELRFALPAAMDIEVWGRLSLSDRAFLEELVQNMPAFLSELEMSGVKLKRDWEDWRQLVRDVARILKGGSESPLLQVSTPLTPKRTASRAKKGVRK